MTPTRCDGAEWPESQLDRGTTRPEDDLETEATTGDEGETER